jgi:hypothetical protein
VLAVYRRSLLWLAAPEQPLTLSFHPELRGPLTLEAIGPAWDGSAPVLPGTAVTRDGAFLRFGPGLAVDLRGVHLWDPPLPDLTPARAEAVLRLIAPWRQAQSSAAGLGGLVDPSSLWADRAKTQLQALCRALPAGDRTVVAEAVRNLVGLGPGLTPSGDDFLAGALAALQAMSHAQPGAAIAAELLAGAVAQSLDRTTPVSRQFLRWALHGRYGESVLELLVRPGADTLQRLLHVGATSGADTLLGIWTGLHLALGRPVPVL